MRTPAAARDRPSTIVDGARVLATDGSERRGRVESQRFVPARTVYVVRGAGGELWEIPAGNLALEEV